MRAPEICWHFAQPKDTAGPTFEVLAREFDLTGLLLSISLALVGIPKDKILVLTNGSIMCNPGAAQTVTLMELSGFSAAGLRVEIAQQRPEAVVAQDRTLNWAGEVYLMGRGDGEATVRMSGTFDANANNNTLEGFLYGVVVPRGNAAPF